MNSPTTSRVVTATRTIPAPAEAIFELIADPARQPEWDGNDNLLTSAEGQRVHAVGDVFVMTLSSHLPGTSPDRENHVVEFEEGRLIAWKPSLVGQACPGHLWRWELEPLSENETRVSHTYDWTELEDEQRLARAASTDEAYLAASIERLASRVQDGR